MRTCPGCPFGTRAFPLPQAQGGIIEASVASLDLPLRTGCHWRPCRDGGDGGDVIHCCCCCCIVADSPKGKRRRYIVPSVAAEVAQRSNAAAGQGEAAAVKGRGTEVELMSRLALVYSDFFDKCRETRARPNWSVRSPQAPSTLQVYTCSHAAGQHKWAAAR